METITQPIQKQELTIIDKSIEIFKGGGQILLTNQARASKALQVGENILAALEQAGGKMDETLDSRCNKYLVNCSTAVDEMQAQRKPITQLMDNIKKMFTEEEAKLDSKNPKNIGYKIQQLRNQYAKDLAVEQDRLRKEAEVKAAKNMEANEIRSYIKNEITGKLLGFLANKKRSITDSFNAITIEIFDDKSAKLAVMSTAFPDPNCAEIIKYNDPQYRLHDYTGYNTIRAEEHVSYDFKYFYKEYERQITELKQSLIDRLPAKKQELDQEAEQKRLAAEAEENARNAKNEKERLEAIEKQKQIEAEQKKQADEKEQRELEEKLRLQKEEDQRKLEADQKLQMEKSSNATQVMFDQVADTASVMQAAPETRSGYEITILNKAGIVELFQFWFTREAITLNIDEMMKKNLAQIKAYAEAVAKKDDIKIESKNLKYESTIKSVNRKVVK